MAALLISTVNSRTTVTNCSGASAAAIFAALPPPRRGAVEVLLFFTDEDIRGAYAIAYAVAAMRTNTRGDSDWFKWVANNVGETEGLEAVLRAVESIRVFHGGVTTAALGDKLVFVALQIVDSAMQDAPQYMYTQRLVRRWAPPNYMDLDTEPESENVRGSPQAPSALRALLPLPTPSTAGVSQKISIKYFLCFFLALSVASESCT